MGDANGTVGGRSVLEHRDGHFGGGWIEDRGEFETIL